MLFAVKRVDSSPGVMKKSSKLTDTSWFKTKKWFLKLKIKDRLSKKNLKLWKREKSSSWLIANQLNFTRAE